jgi:hypothetical protein
VDDRPAVGRPFRGARIAGKKTEPERRPITYWLDYVRSVAGPTTADQRREVAAEMIAFEECERLEFGEAGELGEVAELRAPGEVEPLEIGEARHRPKPM